MRSTLDIAGVHTGGLPSLSIGIRGREFKFSMTDDNTTIILTDAISGDLLKFISEDSITKTEVAALMSDKFKSMNTAPTSDTPGNPGDVIFVI